MQFREEHIGGQLLILGDCLDVMPTLGAVDAVVTDPPYSILGGGSSTAGKGTDDAFDTQFFRVWLREVLSIAPLKPTSAWWMTIDWRGCVAAEQAVARSGLRLAAVGVWDRGGLGMGYALRKTYENFVIIVGEKWQRNQTDEPDVWRHEWFPSSRNFGHQAEKPLSLMTRACEVVGGETILDPFMGSGTTLVACQRLGRAGIGIEIDPDYFEIACRRVDEATRQPDLFVAPVEAPKQVSMFDGVPE